MISDEALLFAGAFGRRFEAELHRMGLDDLTEGTGGYPAPAVSAGVLAAASLFDWLDSEDFQNWGDLDRWLEAEAAR